MTRLEALICLNKCNIGSVKLSRLLEVFDKPENILKASQSSLINAGAGVEAAEQICSFKNESLDRELKQAKSLGLKILTFEDKDYPHNLKYIPGLPIALYVKGELKKEDSLAIGIVGSRNASFYGLASAEKFAAELADKGYTIVSGMARGVDTFAHRGALKQGGRTIAVIGSGFNQIYPPENQELAEEIAKSGAVISEFPVDEPPQRENFPRRNRVISGLSLGILVAEAARNSGALITADFALEQGREVFALPGKVDSNTSFGTNELIKQGAKLVTSVDDILDEFNPVVNKPPKAKKEVEAATKLDLKNKEESRVYDFITETAIDMDELVEKTNLDITGISDILLRLQLKKLIKALPGKQFARN